MTSVHPSVEIALPNYSNTLCGVEVESTLPSRIILDKEANSSPICFVSRGSNICDDAQSMRAENEILSIPITDHPTDLKNALLSLANFPSKRPRHKPGERRELLRQAVNDVLTEHISMRRAAQRYNLAKSSLCDFVRKNGILLPNMRCKSVNFQGSTVRRSVSPTAARAYASVQELTKVKQSPQHHLSHDLAPNTKCQFYSTPVSATPSQHIRCTTTSAIIPNQATTPLVTSPDFEDLNPSTAVLVSHSSQAVQSLPPIAANGVSLPSNSWIESPWCNAAGLPTQVPIRSWGLMRTDNGPPLPFTSIPRSAPCTVSNALQDENAFCSISFDREASLPDEASRVCVSYQHSSPSAAEKIDYSTSRIPAAVSFDINTSLLKFPPLYHSSTISFSDPHSPGSQLSVFTSNSVANCQDQSNHYSNPPIAHLHPASYLENPLKSDSSVHLTDNTYFYPIASQSISFSDSGVLSPSPGITSDALPSSNLSLYPSAAAVAAEVYLAANSHSLLSPFLGHFSSAAALAVATAARSLLQPSPAVSSSLTSVPTSYLSTPTLEASKGPQTRNRLDIEETPVSPDCHSNSLQIRGHHLLSSAHSVDPFCSLQPSRDSWLPNFSLPTVPQQALSLALSRPHLRRLLESIMTSAKDLISFIDKSPSPFHVVKSVEDILSGNGFRELSLHDAWHLKPNDCVYIKANNSSLFAIAIGGGYQVGNGFSILGAHTDSPCLRLKPISGRCVEGYVQTGVETYGGGLWYTWFDRNLTLAGRCIVRQADGALASRLVNIVKPIACVPSLAIHLNREAGKSFTINPEQHLAPILCTSLMEQMMTTKVAPSGGVNQATEAEEKASTVDHSASQLPISDSGQPPALLRLLSKELSVPDKDIVEMELYFADTQPSCIGGVHSEFIHAPRLDNQFNSFTAIQGLLSSMASLGRSANVRMVCLFDHEEVGSSSAQGANSVLTANIFRRLLSSLAQAGTDSDCLFGRTMANSFLLSADQAHAVHPAYSDRHEACHKPSMHGGLVLKYNSNQRYATNGLTAAVIRQIALLANVPLQEFVIRQDQPSGSTIGPFLAAQLGVATADIGGPQLAMHSCREMASTSTVPHAISLYSAFFEHLPKVWSQLNGR